MATYLFQFIYRMDKLGKMRLECRGLAGSPAGISSYIERHLISGAEAGDRFIAVDADKGDVLGQWLVEVPEPTKQLVTLPEWR